MSLSRHRAHWHEVTALFGGVFDPPHLGHKEAIRGLFQYPGVRRVRVIPSAAPPHKPTVATLEQRIAMCQIAFPPSAEIELDFREIERSLKNPARPSYTIDTLMELRDEIPQLAFVIGADQLAQLHSWHRFPEILHLSHWIVLGRKPGGIPKALQTLHQWKASGWVRSRTDHEWEIQASGKSILVVSTEATELSSTAIRETIARTGSPLPHTVLPEIEGYLKLHRIYGTNVNR